MADLQEHVYFSRGDTLTLSLVIALARREGYFNNEIVSQRAVIVACTDAQWVDMLKEAQSIRR